MSVLPYYVSLFCVFVFLFVSLCMFKIAINSSLILFSRLYCKINYSSSERYEGEEHVARFLQDAAMHDGRLSDSCEY